MLKLLSMSGPANPEDNRVADLIRAAFRGVKLGNGVGLLQGQGLDDYADAQTLERYRSKDEKNDWTKIQAEDLNGCHSSLSFFDAEGMRFHLPAYLIADLEGTLTQDVLFHLTYVSGDGLARFALLNPEQRSAVRQFLLLRLREGEFENEMIENALANYWSTE